MLLKNVPIKKYYFVKNKEYKLYSSEIDHEFYEL